MSKIKRILTIMVMVTTSAVFLNGLARADKKPVAVSPPKKRSSCSTCPLYSQDNSLDSLATFGQRTQPAHFSPVMRSLFDGVPVNFVSTATGHLAFAVTDMTLPGILPIVFQRVYSSERTEDTGLGRGWSFIFDDRIAIDGDNATLAKGDGSTLVFRRDGESTRFLLRTSEPGPHQAFDVRGDTVIEQVGRVTLTYQRLGLGDKSVYRLTKVADPNENAVVVSFDSRGNIGSINGSGGRQIAFEWSKGKQPKLLAVSDSAGRRVVFTKKGSLLRAVKDPAGAQWSYKYDNERLNRATDPEGRTVLRIRYDGAGRVIESGDAAGVVAFSYNFTSPDTGSGRLISQRTTVTDPTGMKVSYEHSRLGAIVSFGDEEVRMLEVEYNAANRPVRTSDWTGEEKRFAYDLSNQPIDIQSGGDEETYSYGSRGQIRSFTKDGILYTTDDLGNVVSARGNDPDLSYRVTNNLRGQPIYTETDAGSKTSMEYNSAGNLIALTNNKVGRVEIELDAAGHTVAKRFPYGISAYYEYDPRGNVVRVTNSRLEAIAIERDAAGVITGFAASNGEWVRAARDQAGRIIKLTTSTGKARRFSYDARGMLTEYINALGDQVRLTYDRKGRVSLSSSSLSLQRSPDNGGSLDLSSAKDEFISEVDGLGASLRFSDANPFGAFTDGIVSPASSVPCLICIDREIANCQNTWYDCLKGITPIAAGMAGCFALWKFPPAVLACIIVVLAAVIVASGICLAQANLCAGQIVNRCWSDCH